jgi:hypothetical protein
LKTKKTALIKIMRLNSSAVFSGPHVSRDNINLKWENEKLMLNIGPGIHLKEYSK